MWERAGRGGTGGCDGILFGQVLFWGRLYAFEDEYTIAPCQSSAKEIYRRANEQNQDTLSD